MTSLQIDVDPTAANSAEFAAITLRGDLPAPVPLDVEYAALKPLGAVPPVALDLLLFAAAVYAADKAVDRGEARDAWTRDFELRVPVSDPPLWEGVADDLAACVSFLSGDRWRLRFEPLACSLLRPRSPRRRGKGNAPPPPRGDGVSLFSGGLDSLVGVIDALADGPNRTLVLVGHHDPAVPGPLTDQRETLRRLPAALRNRATPTWVRVRPDGKAADINLRSRSLLFVALGVYAAAAVAPGGPVLIPENGMIALNPPLTPSRRGSCSTRTAHPHYLALLRGLLGRLGLPADLRNPLEAKTKGEVLTTCRDPAALRAALPYSVSCAKRSRRGHWDDRTATHCGHCVPCIYRRAALLAAGIPQERYGLEVIGTDRDWSDPKKGALSDLRALCSLVRRSLDEPQLARLLRGNAPLPAAQVAGHAATVSRGIEEVRELIRQLGVASLRSFAGC